MLKWCAIAATLSCWGLVLYTILKLIGWVFSLLFGWNKNIPEVTQQEAATGSKGIVSTIFGTIGYLFSFFPLTEFLYYGFLFVKFWGFVALNFAAFLLVEDVMKRSRKS